MTDEKFERDLALLTVQTLTRLRAMAAVLEAGGHLQRDIDCQIRDSFAAAMPAMRAWLLGRPDQVTE